MSRIEDRVAAEIIARAEMGKAKYGHTMEREDLSIVEWLRHAQEEAMDLAVYLERLIELFGKMNDEPVIDNEFFNEMQARYM
jgi:hypothetical protein